MKIVVIGGTGLIGSKLVTLLRARGHEALAASPNSGVNTLTGEGLDAALAGCDVVVDVANSPSFADDAVLDFFTTSGRNLLAAARRAGVRHHVALSVVGTQRLGAHPQLTTFSPPCGARPIGVDLDAEPVGIVQVDGLADQVVRGADSLSQVADVAQDGEVVEPEPPAGRHGRTSGPLLQHHQWTLILCPEGRTTAVLFQQTQPDHLLIVAK